jgi:putative transposase
LNLTFHVTLIKVVGCMPKVIAVDNGSEYNSRKMDAWAYENHIGLDFIRPGKPIDNAFVEGFNGRLRDECLNVNVFYSLDDARQKIEEWRIDYKTRRPRITIQNNKKRDVL